MESRGKDARHRGYEGLILLLAPASCAKRQADGWRQAPADVPASLVGMAQLLNSVFSAGGANGQSTTHKREDLVGLSSGCPRAHISTGRRELPLPSLPLSSTHCSTARFGSQSQPERLTTVRHGRRTARRHRHGRCETNAPNAKCDALSADCC